MKICVAVFLLTLCLCQGNALTCNSCTSVDSNIGSGTSYPISGATRCDTTPYPTMTCPSGSEKCVMLNATFSVNGIKSALQAEKRGCQPASNDGCLAGDDLTAAINDYKDAVIALIGSSLAVLGSPTITYVADSGKGSVCYCSTDLCNAYSADNTNNADDTTATNNANSADDTTTTTNNANSADDTTSTNNSDKTTNTDNANNADGTTNANNADDTTATNNADNAATNVRAPSLVLLLLMISLCVPITTIQFA